MGWPNVIRPEQNTANVNSEKWTWLQIFQSPSPSLAVSSPSPFCSSPSRVKMDFSPDSSTTSLTYGISTKLVVRKKLNIKSLSNVVFRG